MDLSLCQVALHSPAADKGASIDSSLQKSPQACTQPTQQPVNNSPTLVAYMEIVTDGTVDQTFKNPLDRNRGFVNCSIEGASKST